ncbi:Na(+)/citrate cotransporter-like isoform X5 [Dermacentor albipictus]|uniref:Na(+)/citrate cotransporter-like isoform X5 n=1 Tax=Dermacentor albipictus TaxID=60249 RepID=UPI0031FDF678
MPLCPGFRKAFVGWKLWYIFAVPLLLLPLPIYMGNKAGLSAYAMIWMAAYWTLEPIPLAVTALMPLVLFPMFGVLSSAKTTTLYFNNIGFVLFGSLAVAAAVETSRLHQRLALKSLLGIGTSNRRLFGQDDVTFLSWMAYNVPPMLLCTMLAWMYVQWKVAKLTPMGAEEAIRERVKLELLRRYHQLGPMTFHQAAVLALTTFMIFLWLTQNPRVIPGWSNLFPYGKQILSSVPAVLVSILLFVVPKDPRQGLRSKGLLTWEEASVKIHWGTIFIICGGMTLAEASKDSGLSAMLVLQMRGLNVMPSYLVVGVLCFSASMLTEVTSNTAITAIMLPIIFEMAVALEVHPLYFAIPVVVACSFSFMLPAATPPNAIVYEMGNFRIVDMAAPGFVMNMVCVVVELVAIHTLGPLVFGLRSLPEGAAATDKNATVARALTERAVQSAR